MRTNLKISIKYLYMARRDKIFNNKKFAYRQKKYKNPFFQIKIKKRRIAAGVSLRVKLIFAVVLLLIGWIIWFCFYSNYFKITSVIVNGAEKMSARDIENTIWAQTGTRRFFILPQKSLPAFSREQLIKKINSNYNFDKLEVVKQAPNMLFINLKEKSCSAIWRDNATDKYYLIDSEGNVIFETNPLELKDKNYPLIEYAAGNVIEGRLVKGQDGNIKYILNLNNELKQSGIINNNDCRYKIDNEANTVKFIIENGTEVYFNVKEDVNKQIIKLKAVLDERLKNFNKKNYIDLRFGDKVYYH